MSIEPNELILSKVIKQEVQNDSDMLNYKT